MNAVQWRVYLAARYGRREELCRYADELTLGGFTVTSTWLHGAHEAADREPCPAWTDWAKADLQDLRSSDVAVCFTEPGGGGRGGRHVELGAALALGIRVIIVGPVEHVFHMAPGVVRVKTWEQALARLYDLQRRRP